MATDKKYIKRIKLGTTEELQVKDIEAVSSINGYTVDPTTGKVVDAEQNEVFFANEPITTATIDGLLSK